jgi:hypothetical protein
VKLLGHMAKEGKELRDELVQTKTLTDPMKKRLHEHVKKFKTAWLEGK